MSWVIYQMLKGLHILLAITWVGGLLFVGWGVFPAVKILRLTEQRLFLRALMQHSHWLFTLAGAGVITTGILLGTVGGPIQSWDALWNTSYGNMWFTALILGIATLIWGVFVGYRRTMKILSDDSLWELAEKGESKPLNKALFITAALESVEVIGFISLLVLMLLLR